jgi:hemimethylated DNA binding protein
MSEARARFQVGQPIHHKRFDYRGVIVDVDPVFCGSEEWYQLMATSRPPKDRPWYHVLVHDAAHQPRPRHHSRRPQRLRRGNHRRSQARDPAQHRQAALRRHPGPGLGQPAGRGLQPERLGQPRQHLLRRARDLPQAAGHACFIRSTRKDAW